MPLSDKEIKELLERAESYWENNEFNKALECYNQIIANASAHPFYFRERAWIHEVKGELHDAISDMNKAIELDPDNAEYYERRGNYFLKSLYDAVDFLSFASESNSPRASERQRAERILTARAKRVFADFKSSLERNPARASIWLNLMELNILLHNFDEAISIYGSCKPYMRDGEDRLIRSWLGCLALIFAGDPIEEDDKRPLYDLIIKTTAKSSVNRVVVFIMGLKKQDSNKEKCEKAIEIQKLLINHFESWCYRGEKFLALECYGEALEAYDKALELDLSDYSATEKKIDVLGRLKRYEDILKWINSSDDIFRNIIIETVIKIFNQLDCDEEAFNLFEKLTQLKPGISEAWYEKGIRLKRFARYEEAFKAFNKAIELKHDNVKAWYSRACMFALRGNKANALNDLSEATKLHYMTKEFARKDEDFKNFRNDLDFRALTEQ